MSITESSNRESGGARSSGRSLAIARTIGALEFDKVTALAILAAAAIFAPLAVAVLKQAAKIVAH
jgi:hypothetical protein